MHAPPDERKLEQLRATLRVLGIELQLPDPVQPRDLAAIAARVRDPQSRALHRIAGGALAGAGGLPAREHRPLRPGADGLRAFHLADPALSGPDGSPRAARAAGAAAAGIAADRGRARRPQGVDLSRLERRADEADRYVATFLKCVYLRDRVGQTFDGLITTVIEFGCFVQLLGLGVDGLLALGRTARR